MGVNSLDGLRVLPYTLDVPTILTLDDDPEVIRLLTLLLEHLGHKVISAPDGIVACTIVQKQAPDLIIADYQLPAGDGVTVLERIQRLLGDRMPPVLFLTGSGPAAAEKATRAFPHSTVLHKPAKMDEIDACLKRILGNK